jgi:hypothetical protein
MDRKTPITLDSNHSDGGLTRRGALACMGWAGTGLLWTMVGGVPTATLLSGSAGAAETAGTAQAFRFVQISDTHVGFAKEANPDAAGTTKAAIDLVNGVAAKTALVVHTGDVTHLSKPAEFDTAAEMLKGLKVTDFHVIPGEHDVLDEKQTAFFDRYGRGAGKGWYSFDHGGVHFLALVNVMEFKPGGSGRLGPDQLEWLEADLKGRSASQPLVILSHIPLWAAYADWGWQTEDWPQAMAYVKRFGSVTALNGHIHQILQKVEGNVRYYSARSTAYPQPAPGQGTTGPGPLKVAADQLKSVLGVRSVAVVPKEAMMSVEDISLA